MDYGIHLMVEGGMSPMEALKSATSVSAEACGVADEVGSLVSGKQADVLIIDGNPLSDSSSVSRRSFARTLSQEASGSRPAFPAHRAVADCGTASSGRRADIRSRPRSIISTDVAKEIRR